MPGPRTQGYTTTTRCPKTTPRSMISFLQESDLWFSLLASIISLYAACGPALLAICMTAAQHQAAAASTPSSAGAHKVYPSASKDTGRYGRSLLDEVNRLFQSIKCNNITCACLEQLLYRYLQNRTKASNSRSSYSTSATAPLIPNSADIIKLRL